MTDRKLLERAAEAMANAYAPYSRFPVGAALECEDGSVFTGCNVENCALGCTMCAESVAVGNAVSHGHTDFVRLAVFTRGTGYRYPCGECRQVLNEFAPNLEILIGRADGRYVSYHLDDLLPNPFNSSQLE
ncbi:MAG: cytidine deaminase [Oscillospiraceae bacterium]|nr:cytidine deaminase [Oscillospiraceae bacterium]